MADGKTIYVSTPSGEKPQSVDDTIQGLKTRIRQQTGVPEETTGVGAGLLFALSNPQLGTPVKRTAPKPKPKPKATAKPKPKRPALRADADAFTQPFQGETEGVINFISPIDPDNPPEETGRASSAARQMLDYLDSVRDSFDDLKAQSMMNPTIYDAPNPEAYQDMVNADFNRYANQPEEAGVREHYTLDDDDTDIVYHVFDRDDGVNVVFAEAPNGRMYNVTDTHGMELE